MRSEFPCAASQNLAVPVHAVRRHWQRIGLGSERPALARHAELPLNGLVMRPQIVVADRPIRTNTFCRKRAEIVLMESRHHAEPGQSAAADTRSRFRNHKVRADEFARLGPHDFTRICLCILQSSVPAEPRPRFQYDNSQPARRHPQRHGAPVAPAPTMSTSKAGVRSRENESRIDASLLSVEWQSFTEVNLRVSTTQAITENIEPPAVFVIRRTSNCRIDIDRPTRGGMHHDEHEPDNFGTGHLDRIFDQGRDCSRCSRGTGEESRPSGKVREIHAGTGTPADLTLLMDGISLADAESDAAKSFPVRVTVDARKPLHAINPLIYGASGVEPARAKALGLSAVRWGGNRSSRYNWKTAGRQRRVRLVLLKRQGGPMVRLREQ